MSSFEGSLLPLRVSVKMLYIWLMEVPAHLTRCLGDAIRSNRKRADLNQNELAEKAGLTRRFIQELENGRSDVSLQTLYRLAYAMDTTLAAISAQIEEAI